MAALAALQYRVSGVAAPRVPVARPPEYSYRKPADAHAGTMAPFAVRSRQPGVCTGFAFTVHGPIQYVAERHVWWLSPVHPAITED